MSKQNVDYAKLSEELDEIISSMQSGDVDVDQAVKKYERGMEIAKQLEQYLQEAENKVKKVKASFGKQ